MSASFSCFVAAFLVMIVPAAARSISVTGTILNDLDPSSHFPEGKEFTVSFNAAEVPISHSDDSETKGYPGVLSNLTITVPETGYVLHPTISSSELEVAFVDRELLKPVVSAIFEFPDPDTNKTMVLRVDWFAKPGSNSLQGELTQDLSPGLYRLISTELAYGAKNWDESSRVVQLYGWSRAGGVSPSSSAPAAVRKNGYDRMLVLGDSLSQSKRTDEPDPETDAMVFDNSLINGPVWVQYLCWLTGTPYDEKWNFSLQGGYFSPRAGQVVGDDFQKALAVLWDQSVPYHAIFSILQIADHDTALVPLRMRTPIRFLQAAELAYSLGARDMLVLGQADVTIAPLVKLLFSLQPSKRAWMRELIDESIPVYTHYINDWFEGLFPGIRVGMADPDVYLAEFLANPASYGITDTGGYHLNGGPEPYADYFGNPGSTYFFWGPINPSTKVHAHLAAKVYDEIFATVPLAEQRFRCQMVHASGDSVWVLGINPPRDSRLKFWSEPGLSHGVEPSRAFETVDPLLFFIVPKVGPRGFYRITRD